MPHVVNIDNYRAYTPNARQMTVHDREGKEGINGKGKMKGGKRKGKKGRGPPSRIGPRSLKPVLVEGNPKLEQQETIPVYCCDLNANSHHLDAN